MVVEAFNERVAKAAREGLRDLGVKTGSCTGQGTDGMDPRGGRQNHRHPPVNCSRAEAPLRVLRWATALGLERSSSASSSAATTAYAGSIGVFQVAVEEVPTAARQVMPGITTALRNAVSATRGQARSRATVVAPACEGSTRTAGRRPRLGTTAVLHQCRDPRRSALGRLASQAERGRIQQSKKPASDH
jgi:hypothetical protein